MELPTGVLGVALGTILLPTLSKHVANDNTAEFSNLLDWGLRLCMLLTLPAAVALAVLSFPLITTLFMYREFTLLDAQMTQGALVAYSFGLIGLIMIKVLAPGFYARQDIRTPVKIAIFTLVMTQLMNLAFIGPLKHVGLALAIGLGACLNAGLLYILLRKKGLYQPGKGWAAFLLKLTTALLIMGGGLWLAQDYLQLQWVEVRGWQRVLQLSGLIVLGVALYFGSLAALGFKPRHFKRSEH